MNETALRKGMPKEAIFKSLRPLTEDFIPNKIHHRDEQIGKINYCLSSLIRYGILMNNIIIHGHPGTGKTHSVKSVLTDIEPKINSFYGRAYRSTSAHAFFRSFIEKNFGLSLHPRESISVYFSAFEKAISDLKTVLLVFDDIQYLLYEDSRGLDGLLFYLSRLDKNLGIILIGNIRVNDLTLALEAPTASSLKLRPVYFSKYNSIELKDILMERARESLSKKAFKQSGSAISLIAALTAQGWGSARYALDLLKEAAMVSEEVLGRDYISPESVEQAEEMLEVVNYEDQIRDLPKQALAVLEAVYRLRGGKELSTGDVYSEYEKVCGASGLNPFSLRKVSDIITELDSTGLISCRLVSRGRFGRTRLVNWPPNSALERVYESMRDEEI
jgi:cell division control protein 6